MRKRVFCSGLILLMMGCSVSSFSDLRSEGEAQTKKLANELSAIETKEELELLIPDLKKRFMKIAEILVQIEQFPSEEKSPSMASEYLFAELARLYEMPGGKELIESAQVDAIEYLQKEFKKDRSQEDQIPY